MDDFLDIERIGNLLITHTLRLPNHLYAGVARSSRMIKYTFLERNFVFFEKSLAIYDQNLSCRVEALKMLTTESDLV